MRSLYLPFFVSAMCLIMAAGCSRPADIRELPPGETMTRKTPGVSFHTYRFTVGEETYQEIEARQMGLDITLKLTRPDDSTLTWDTIGKYGRELICFRARQSGIFTLEISAYDPNTMGSYELERRVNASPGSIERRRARAFDTCWKAKQLHRQREHAPVALELADEAAGLWSALGEQDQAIVALYYKATASGISGLPLKKIETYEEGLALAAASDNGHLQGQFHQNLGTAYQKLGFFTKAVNHYRQALNFRGREDIARANTLESMGLTYAQLGDSRTGKKYLLEAFDIFERTRRLDKIRPFVYSELAKIYRREGNFEDADELLERAFRMSGDRAEDLIGVYKALARSLVETGQAAQALKHYRKALSMVPQDRLESRIYLETDMAEALIDLNREIEARDLLVKHLPFHLNQGNAQNLLHIQHNLLRISQRIGGNKELETAIMGRMRETLNEIRISNRSNELWDRFAERRFNYQETFLGLVLETAKDPAAEGFSQVENSRAAILRDVYSPDREILEPTMKTELARREDQILDLRFQSLFAPRDQQDGLDRLARTLVRGYTAMMSWSADGERENPSTPTVTLPQVQKMLKPGTSALYFALCHELIYLWRITARETVLATIENRRRVESDAEDFLKALAEIDEPGREKRIERLGARLGKELLGDLPEDTERLIIIPDGALHFIPFGALQVPGGKRLGLQYEITLLPSFSVGAALYRRAVERPAPAGVALFAISEFADMPDLPHAGEEAEEIRRIAGRTGHRPVFSRINDQVSKTALQEPVVQKAAYIHVATHGENGTDDPFGATLVFSSEKKKDRFLNVSEVARFKLNADLVCLSACRTALGRNTRLRGMMGFSQGFFKAGANGVLSSLWQVSDKATRELMVSFYRALLEDDLSPPAAMLQARREMVSRSGYADPFYWAGFSYSGVW